MKQLAVDLVILNEQAPPTLKISRPLWRPRCGPVALGHEDMNR